MHQSEVAPFRTTMIRLLEGDRFVLTEDANRGWVDWPNLYCLADLRTSYISLSAMRHRMNAVCQFHNWAAVKDIDIRERVESARLFTVEEVEALRKELRVNLLTRTAAPRKGGHRKPKRPVVSGRQWAHRCIAVRDYVAWHAAGLADRVVCNGSDDFGLPSGKDGWWHEVGI